MLSICYIVVLSPTVWGKGLVFVMGIGVKPREDKQETEGWVSGALVKKFREETYVSISFLIRKYNFSLLLQEKWGHQNPIKVKVSDLRIWEGGSQNKTSVLHINLFFYWQKRIHSTRNEASGHWVHDKNLIDKHHAGQCGGWSYPTGRTLS